MLFFSPIYIFVFLPLCIYLYYFSNSKNKRKLVLIIFSIIFYSYWNISHLPIIIVSILLNFQISKILLQKFNSKKNILWLGIIFNLLLLTVFKYSNFIILNINLFFSINIEDLEIDFPLAISFFTFQSIAFLVNCYDKEIKKVNFIDYTLFIFFFPQLVAGPIVKYKDMAPQFNKLITFNTQIFNTGMLIFFVGFLKKIMIADNLGFYVDASISNIEELNFYSSWLLSLSFSFQFYFDFTGYVDMAIGTALMLGIHLPQNFNSPFKATSIIDFWHRWHITLSNFLNNYVLNPLVRSLEKITFFKLMFSILIVFTLAGLWHGPSWNFLVFGIFHGIGIIINHVYKKFIDIKLNKFFAIFLTFNYVNISFLIFRAETLSEFYFILSKMFLPSIGADIYDFNNNLILLIVSFVICFFCKNTHEIFFNKKKNI